MKKITSLVTLLTICVLLLGCQDNIPKPGFWTGAATLAEGRQLAIRMYLDLNARQGFLKLNQSSALARSFVRFIAPAIA